MEKLKLDGASIWGGATYDDEDFLGRFTAGGGKTAGEGSFPLEIILSLYG